MSGKRVVCFGELLLRLGAPGRERLLQTPQLNVHVGGAEANVAVALAHFGHSSALLSILPDNALGAAAVGEMRRQGVDTSHIGRADGRMGLYFLETGAMHRPSDVLYDRAGSAFALALPDAFDWNALVGADVLHISGITPAIGANPAQAAIHAVASARARGITVAFDGNFRAKLWRTRDANPAEILRPLFAGADVLFADHRDIGVALGRDFTSQDPLDDAAAAAFAAFPQLARIACLQRIQHSVDQHELCARLYSRDDCVSSESCSIGPIVDRIGAGDAFAAGLLHGVCNAMSDRDMLDFAHAAACLKHSLPGDSLQLSAAEVAAFVGERRFDVRR